MRESLARGIALAVVLLGPLGCGGGVDVHRVVETIPASWSVEEVDVRRGEVRVAGPVDVDERAGSIDLVDPCTKRAAGRGVWTRNRLVWWLTTDDLSAALACSSTLGLTARAKAGTLAMAGIAETISVRLALSDESNVGIDALSLVQHGADTLIQAHTEGASGLRLALDGVSGPSELSDDGETAHFRIPTAGLVAVALRRGTLRVFTGTGEREARARLVVFVDNHEVAVPEPEPEVAVQLADHSWDQ